MDLLCYMWFSPTRGELTGTYQEIAKLVGADNGDFDLFLTEAETHRFCDIFVTSHEESQKCHDTIRIRNRRMWRDEKARDDARLRKQRQREKEQEGKASRKRHKNVTPPSPIPTPTPVHNICSYEHICELSKKKFTRVPHQEIINIYRFVLPSLPQVKKWPEHLQKYLRARWKEDPDRQNVMWWYEYFLYIKESGFLMGKKTDFQADMEWIIRPTNMTKIINGRYHRDHSVGSKGISDWVEWRLKKESGHG